MQNVGLICKISYDNISIIYLYTYAFIHQLNILKV